MKVTDVTNFFGLTNIQENEPGRFESPKVLEPESREERKTLFTWEAAVKPQFIKINQKKIKTLTVVGIAVCVILIAMQEFFLILGVLSLIFVSYMLTQAPPENIRYEITNEGVKFDTMFYSWANMKYFFFTEEGGHKAVAIDMINTLPSRLYLAVNQQEQKKVKDLLKHYVHFLEEEPKTFVSKAFESALDKLDLENA